LNVTSLAVISPWLVTVNMIRSRAPDSSSPRSITMGSMVTTGIGTLVSNVACRVNLYVSVMATCVTVHV